MNTTTGSFPQHLLNTTLFRMSNCTLHAHLKDELNAHHFPSKHHELLIHIQALPFPPTCVPEGQTPQSDDAKSMNMKNIAW